MALTFSQATVGSRAFTGFGIEAWLAQALVRALHPSVARHEVALQKKLEKHSHLKYQLYVSIADVPYICNWLHG
jgi:hypothetical protein